ncbi:hypothetical protein ACFWH7_03710 [Cellulosimicrobium cellulans]|uniref:DUF3885 domain-containing protein n=1 Tax=Cellulosimicrobium cellulans TaxID=1710 RepID=UPI00366732C0
MRLPPALDSLRSGLEFRSMEARGAVRSRWRRLQGRHGAFTQGEVSARATRLTELWERRWPDVEPLGHMLRVECPDRWVRFHSLPESKRYAENATDYEEILRRHRTVLYELLGSADSRALHGLYVIGVDWDWRDLAAGWTKRHLPGAWPWRSSAPNGDDGHHYFWAASDPPEPEIDALLLGAADDQCHIVIGAHDLSWLYCPYDGGADVLLPSKAERDALKERHTDWLSSYPGGL